MEDGLQPSIVQVNYMVSRKTYFANPWTLRTRQVALWDEHRTARPFITNGLALLSTRTGPAG